MTPAQIIQDPNFLNKTDYEGKRTVLSTIDPRFKGMSQQDQNTVLDQLQPLPAGGFQGPGPIPPGTNNPNFGQASSQQPGYPLSPITDILPTLGAGLGMVAGEGLLSIPAAGLGGAAGSEISSALKEKYPKLFGPGPDNPEYEATIQGLLQGVAPEAGGQILGALAKGGIPAAHAMAAALKAGGGDAAVGTAKIGTGIGTTLGAHAIAPGLGLTTALQTRRLISSGGRQIASGVRAGTAAAKDTFAAKMAEAEAPEMAGTLQQSKPGAADFSWPGEMGSQIDPTTKPIMPQINLTPSRGPVTLFRESTLNPDVAKQLKPGDTRIMPDGSTQTLRQVPIDNIEGDAGNKIYEKTVKAYQDNGYTNQPQLRNNPDSPGNYIIDEGHHRILSDVRNGKSQITAWTTDSPVGTSKIPVGQPQQ